MPRIAFREIPSSIRRPGAYAELNRSASRGGLPANDQHVLVLAQKIKTPDDWAGTTSYSVGDVIKPTTLNDHYYVCVVAGTSGSSEPTWPVTGAATVSDGTVTWMEYVNSGELVAANVPTSVYSADEASRYFGAGSIAHMTVTALIDAYPYTRVTVCAADDAAAATKATGSIAITGTATAPGSITARIGNESVTAAFASSDAAATVATALAAAINAVKHTLPVIATVSSGTVTLHAKNGGTLANQIRLSVAVSGTGISATPTAFASGATDPDLGVADGVLDKVFPGDYSVYCSSFNDDDTLGDIRDHIEILAGPVEKRGCILVYGYTDLTGTSSNVKTQCGTTLNHWRTGCNYIRATRSTPWEIAGAAAGAWASRPHLGRPMKEIPLPGIHEPAVEDRITSHTEIEDLLASGVTPLTVIPGVGVAMVRGVSTALTNPQGATLATHERDLTRPRVADYVRLSTVNRYKLKFGDALAYDITRKAVRSELLDVLYLLEEEKYVEHVDDLKGDLIVEVNSADHSRFDAQVPAQIVPGLYVFAERIDLL